MSKRKPESGWTPRISRLSGETEEQFASRLFIRKRQLAKIRGNRASKKMRADILQKLGGRCSNPACQWLNADGTRGCIDERCLQVDHVHGGGKKELSKYVSRQAYYRQVLADTEGKYQLLCANCNWIKRSIHNEI